MIHGKLKTVVATAGAPAPNVTVTFGGGTAGTEESWRNSLTAVLAANAALFPSAGGWNGYSGIVTLKVILRISLTAVLGADAARTAIMIGHGNGVFLITIIL
jgi:hypothetical protein